MADVDLWLLDEVEQLRDDVEEANFRAETAEVKAEQWRLEAIRAHDDARDSRTRYLKQAGALNGVLEKKVVVYLDIINEYEKLVPTIKDHATRVKIERLKQIGGLTL